jgi:hypothetical protein
LFGHLNFDLTLKHELISTFLDASLLLCEDGKKILFPGLAWAFEDSFLS